MGTKVGISVGDDVSGSIGGFVGPGDGLHPQLLFVNGGKKGQMFTSIKPLRPPSSNIPQVVLGRPGKTKVSSGLATTMPEPQTSHGGNGCVVGGIICGGVGKSVLGAGVLGAGVLGAGVLGAGVFGLVEGDIDGTFVFIPIPSIPIPIPIPIPLPISLLLLLRIFLFSINSCDIKDGASSRGARRPLMRLEETGYNHRVKRTTSNLLHIPMVIVLKEMT